MTQIYLTVQVKTLGLVYLKLNNIMARSYSSLSTNPQTRYKITAQQNELILNREVNNFFKGDNTGNITFTLVSQLI